MAKVIRKYSDSNTQIMLTREVDSFLAGDSESRKEAVLRGVTLDVGASDFHLHMYINIYLYTRIHTVRLFASSDPF